MALGPAARAALAALALAIMAPGFACAEDTPEFAITIRDHRFEPAEIHVPAGKRTILRISNEDDMSEEFDSTSLKVEKVIAARASGTIRLRALEPGRYDFIGEYHDATAKGVVIAE